MSDAYSETSKIPSMSVGSIFHTWVNIYDIIEWPPEIAQLILS